MGYDVHITRQDHWADDEIAKKISLEEWRCYVKSDEEMRMDNQAEVDLKSGAKLACYFDGLSVWLRYSGSGLNGNYAWFDFFQGNIVVKNPDKEILGKMIDISSRLQADVQGDEGEKYLRSSNDKIFFINGNNETIFVNW